MTAVPGAIELSWDGDRSDGREAMLGSGRIRLVGRFYLLIGALALLLGLLSVALHDRAVAVKYLLLGALLLLLARPLTWWLARRGARNLPHLTGPRRVLAVPGDGLTITVESGSQHHPWGSFERVRETRRAFLVHHPGRAVFPVVLARRGLADPAQVAALRTLLTEQIRLAKGMPVAQPEPRRPAGPLPAGGFDLAWTPQREDWAELFAARARTPRARRYRVLLILLALALPALGLLQDDLVLIVSGLLFCALLLFLAGPGRSLAIRRFWRQAPILQHPQLARLVPGEGLTLVSGESVSRWRWDEFGSVLDTPLVFVLQGAGKRRFFLPLAKRGLADRSRLEALGELLQREIGS